MVRGIPGSFGDRLGHRLWEPAAGKLGEPGQRWWVRQHGGGSAFWLLQERGPFGWAWSSPREQLSKRQGKQVVRSENQGRQEELEYRECGKV